MDCFVKKMCQKGLGVNMIVLARFKKFCFSH